MLKPANITQAITLPDGVEIPNLDCMTMDPDELEAWGTTLQADITTLFPHPTVGQRNLAMSLVQYAHTRAAAMRARMEGRISVALRLEGDCEAIYLWLPQNAKW